MTNKRSTKRALLVSVLSLLLCVSMLIGTTYAWFTDTAVSANNIIKAGTLDIEMEYWNGTEWMDIEGSSDILAGDLWEPGYTDVAYLRVKNAGTLALEYSLGVNIVSETAGVNKAGETFLLSDYIYFDVAEGVNGETAAYKTREDAMKIATESTKISAGYTKGGNLVVGSDYVYLALVAYMPTWVGNVANHNGTDVPEIDLGLSVFATQYTYEEDTFNELYDKNAAVFKVEDANALLAENKDVTLINCDDPNGVLTVPNGYTGTLTLGNVNIASVQASDTAKIVIMGKVAVKATTENTSAISGVALDISGNGSLTAIANGNHAYGIGGDATKSITIKDITIDYISGGHPYGVGSDTKYYTNAPEGGAAIGSGKDGAVITLDGVTVNNAIGGSKAAAIGARYWTGVTVNITDSTILYAEGGVSAAGIGGSRVSENANESGTTVNIANSTVTAKGGAYGAGIGSGYDTHCGSTQPLCTVNITDSTIDATGGKYAAGVGTGYHNAALKGVIKDSTVTAVSGEKFYKETYTLAMDIGFGVVDPAREGVQTGSSLTYNGEEITLDGASYMVNSAEALATALIAGDGVVLNDDIDLPITSLGSQTPGSGQYKLGDKNTKEINIDLNGHKLNITTTYWSAIGAVNPEAVITIKNGTMTSSTTTGTWNSYDLGFTDCQYVIENVVFDKAIYLDSNAVLKNVTVNETHDYYALWIPAKGQTVEIDGLTVNSAGRGIKIDEEYVGNDLGKVTLKVSNATFNTEKKAAILVKSAAGAEVVLNNVDIANTPDPVNAVWVDEDAASYADLVTVTGGNKIVEL